jgi:tumor protein p53-inducible protein 3
LNQKVQSASFFSSFSYFKYKEKLINEFTEKILKHFESGLIQPIIDSEFAIEQVSEAHARIESNKNMGKVLMKVFGEIEERNDL